MSEEQLAAYELRRAKAIGNCEPVKLASPRRIMGAAADTASVRQRTEPLYPLVGLCHSAGLAEPIPEYAFAKPRRWRFDYAWPLHKLALEINGGVWTQGRHNRGAGAIADQEKLSEAAILGWRVLYAIPDDLRNGVALGRIMRALGVKEAA